MATSDGPLAVLLVGGDLALDFVNTIGGPREGPPDHHDDALTGYDDLIVWCRRVGVVREREAARLRRAAAARRSEAARVFRAAIELRQLLYDSLRPFADGNEPSAEILKRLADGERKALSHAAVGRDGWSWEVSGDLRAPLWVLTHAAVELLTHGPLDRLKVCANCRWLFLDESRNHSRRWCSMEECGVHIKKQRFVEQRRSRRG